MRLARLVLLILALAAKPALAAQAMTIAFGNGTGSLNAYRLAYARSFAVTTNKRSRINGYFEFGITHLLRVQTITGLNASAVVRLPLRIILPMFIDLGFGVNNFSRDQFVGRDLGSKLLFEERVGIGVLLGRSQNLELGYRLMHFSNGYLANSNHGLNLHLLALGYWF